MHLADTRAKGGDEQHGRVTHAAAIPAVQAPAAETPVSRVLLAVIGACIAILVTNLYVAQPLIVTIAGDLRIAPRVAGVVVSASQFGYGLGLFLLVPLSDNVENRRLVLACGAVAVAGTVGLATAKSAGAFLACAFVTGMFSSGAQMLLPYLSHLLPAASRGRVLGTIMAGVLASVMLARPLSLFSASMFGWRGIYWASAAVTLVLGITLALVMPARRPEHRRSYPFTIASMFTLFARERDVRRRTAYQALLFAAFTMFWAVAPIMLAREFGFGQARTGLFALVGAGGALVSPLAGRWADRGLARRGTLIACLALAAAFATSILAVRWLMLVPLVVAAVVIDAAVQASQTFSRLTVMEVAPDHRGRINALYMTSVYTAGALGSVIGVTVFVAAGWTGVAALGTALAVAVALGVGTEPRATLPDARVTLGHE